MDIQIQQKMFTIYTSSTIQVYLIKTNNFIPEPEVYLKNNIGNFVSNISIQLYLTLFNLDMINQ